MMGKLETLNRELEKQNDILRALCDEYLSIYLVDFNTGEYEIYRVTDRMHGEIAKIARNSRNYTEMMERYFTDHVIEEDVDYLRSATEPETVLEHLKKQKNYTVRYRVRENSRGILYLDAQYTDVSKSPEECIVIMAFRRVDSIVKKELEVKQETMRDMENILRTSGIGIWSIETEEGKPSRMYADAMMRELLGVDESISPEDCYTWWYDRIDENFVGRVEESVDEIIETGRSEVNYLWNHPLFGMIYVRCGGIHDTTYKRNGNRVKGYHQDVTEIMLIKKRQEKETMDALKEAKRASLAKTELLSHMSHDIRTPLNGILGMLTIADKNPKDEKRQQEARQKIRQEAEHLLSLVNDVLEISKIESSEVSISNEPFDIHSVLDNTMGLMHPQAVEKEVGLFLDYGVIPHPYLVGSPLHLRQILINIIGNAIKYNKPDGEVDVYMEETDCVKDSVTCRFVVTDNGIGMSEEFLEHIFEPFTQEASGARTEYQGTGLGMVIVREIVSKMDGTVTVESHPGMGTKVTVEVPLVINEKPVETEETPQQPSAECMKGITVLLAEDNKLNQEITRYMLEEAGASVVIAENGEEAVQMFLNSAPGDFSCILMDIMMPVMDGYEASRAIRAADRADAKIIPIIALSANAFSEDVQKSLDAGMNAHMGKPVQPDRLAATISRYCRK